MSVGIQVPYIVCIDHVVVHPAVCEHVEEMLIEKLKNELKSRVKEIKFKDLANIK